MNIELLIPVALFCVLLAIIVILLVIVLKTRKQLSVLEGELRTSEKKMNELKSSLLNSMSTATTPLKSEVKEARSGLVALQKQLQQIDEKLENVELQQANVQGLDSDSKLYRRAEKMVELGADMEEIIAECEIPRAEAELLMSLRKSQK